MKSSFHLQKSIKPVDLLFVPYKEIERLLSLEYNPFLRAKILADICRVNILYMISNGGSGHIGSSASCIDMVTWLYLNEVNVNQRLFSSKGHDSPAFYATLMALGKIDFDLIHEFRSIKGLPGHPDVSVTPELHTNTGSLGMGISKAKGFVHADRLNSEEQLNYVLTGDGELQEGQIWESLVSAYNKKMGNIIVIVDQNKIQSDTWVDHVSSLGDLEMKFQAFNWITFSCNGNDVHDFSETIERAKRSSNPYPKVILASTVKGAGLSGMEGNNLPYGPNSLYEFHSGAPSESSYQKALSSVLHRLNRNLKQIDQTISFENKRKDKKEVPPHKKNSLIQCYGKNLVECAKRHHKIIALDADLVLDTGLISFREQFPERFIECGIAEQDMVSQAGALALKGFFPVVHSFASFLTSRANEQIFNNATERTKILYVGSLAGLLPAGPGHSHQALRDIATLKCIPSMKIVEPSNERHLKELLQWTMQEAQGPIYLRLVSVPIPSLLNDVPLPEFGHGYIVHEVPSDCHVVIITSGPITLASAIEAAKKLQNKSLLCKVIDMPWVSHIDSEWLTAVVNNCPVVSLENHTTIGGLGDTVLTSLSEANQLNRVLKIGIDGIPACGKDTEVMEKHGIDATSLSQKVIDFLGQ